MMVMIKEDLSLLNVHREVFFSERTLHADDAKKIRAAINGRTLKGHVYKGELPPPKGEKSDNSENREQTLFRSTEVGNDMDRPLVKSDGSFTYFAADVGYIYGDRARLRRTDLRARRRPRRLRQAAEGFRKGMSDGKVDLKVLLCSACQALPWRRTIQMSKRSSDFRYLARGGGGGRSRPVRFMMLYRKQRPLDFDFAKVAEQSKDNPVFYVPYASARCHSVFRQAREQFPGEAFDRGTLAAAGHLLTDEGELGLIRKLR